VTKSRLDWSTLLAQLDAHAAAFALGDEAKQGLEACFTSDEGSIDGWTLADISSEFDGHKLVFGRADLPPSIETRLTLRDHDGHLLGDYRLITSLEGSAIDDYLVFHAARRRI
jgi:hypothetical protein